MFVTYKGRSDRLCFCLFRICLFIIYLQCISTAYFLLSVFSHAVYESKYSEQALNQMGSRGPRIPPPLHSTTDDIYSHVF